MDKKRLFIVLFAFCCMLTSHKTIMAMFGDLFKNLDFEKLSQDMEAILQEIDEQPATTAPQTDFRKPPSPYSAKASQTDQGKPQATLTPMKTDRKSLFLDPIVIEQINNYSGDKGSYNFPRIKQDAYTHFMTRLIKGLKSIENKIVSSSIFSPAFKEEFIQYKKNIDDIVISEGIISDRRFYLRAFFLPQFNTLREKIFAIIPTLESLEAKVTTFLSQQSFNQIESLSQFAQDPGAKIADDHSTTERKAAGPRMGATPLADDKDINLEQVPEEQELELIPAKKEIPQEEPQEEQDPEATPSPTPVDDAHKSEEKVS